MRNVGIGRKGSGAPRFEGVGVKDWRGERNVNTDRLIDALSANLEPVSRGQLGKALTLAIVTGGVAAFGLMLATVGPRPELYSTVHLEWTAVKLLFAFSVIGAAAPFLARSMRPGLEKGTHWLLIFFPFVVAIAAALAMLILGSPQARRVTRLVPTPLSPAHCILRIMLFAAIPLAALIWALRDGAPTRLNVCGAVAGIVAGGIGATAYALSCRGDTIPFIAIWYSAAIAICALVGAQLGPWLLRW
jgi:hypothetical protein